MSNVGKTFEGSGQKAIVAEIQALSKSMDKRIAECRQATLFLVSSYVWVKPS